MPYITTFQKGLNVIKIQNNGDINHELNIIRLNKNYTVDDYINSMKSGGSLGKVGRGVGNVPPLKKGERWEIKSKLKQGNYFLTCFQEDKETGEPHLMRGMVYNFTIE